MFSSRFLASLVGVRAGITPSTGVGRQNGPKTFTFRHFDTQYCLRSSVPARAASRNRAWSSYRAPAAARDEGHLNKVLNSFDHDAPLIETWGNEIPLSSTSISADGHMVSARWSNGEEQDYPAVWLRDNCHCVYCCHQQSVTRSIYLTEMSLETEVRDVSILDNGQVLSVEWDDGHDGVFPTDWLRGHRFDQSHPDPIEGTRSHLWGHDVMSTPHFRLFEFDEVMEYDDALYDWLKMLLNLGIAVLKNAPTEQGQQYLFQNRLGYASPAPTSSGILNQAKLHLSNHHPLYTEERLQLHNDLTYYTQARAFQLFHCIQQVSGDGGDSLLVDGFKVAEDLRSQNPEAFKILSRVPWEYKLAMGKNYHLARREVIRLDPEGEVSQITVNDICRTAMLRIPRGDVRKAYTALKEFTSMLYHPGNLVQYKLQAGDILAFNNHRTLHGRLGFNLHADTQRHLETCYSDWEIVSARMRTLKKQQLEAECKPCDQ